MDPIFARWQITWSVTSTFPLDKLKKFWWRNKIDNLNLWNSKIKMIKLKTCKLIKKNIIQYIKKIIIIIIFVDVICFTYFFCQLKKKENTLDILSAHSFCVHSSTLI